MSLSWLPDLAEWTDGGVTYIATAFTIAFRMAYCVLGAKTGTMYHERMVTSNT
jgi:hypothetical protein